MKKKLAWTLVLIVASLYCLVSLLLFLRLQDFNARPPETHHGKAIQRVRRSQSLAVLPRPRAVDTGRGPEGQTDVSTGLLFLQEALWMSVVNDAPWKLLHCIIAYCIVN